MGYINTEDNEAQALLVPTWVSEISESHTIKEEYSNSSEDRTRQGNNDYLILNAIDGGVINWF